MADELEGYEYTLDDAPWAMEGEPVVLSLREDDAGRKTRRVLRWHTAVKNGVRRFSVDIIHQRWDAQWDVWRNDAFDRRKVHGGESVRIELDQDQTALLREHLNNLFQVNELVSEEASKQFRVYRVDRPPLPANVTEAVRQVLETADADEFARNLTEMSPDFANAVAVVQRHRVLSAALEEFRQHLDANDWSETHWQRFFKANSWIFGYGLTYRFIVTEQAQPNYGGGDVSGEGGQRGDYLGATKADARFAVLVEIKLPRAPLVSGGRYRNGSWHVSKEVAGGIAQLQSNCETWKVASEQRRNVQWAAERNDIRTTQPEAILLIGRWSTLGGDSEKEESVERFRRQLWNPRVLTYDELFERASFVVERAAPNAESDLDPDEAADDANEDGEDEDGGEPDPDWEPEPDSAVPPEPDYDDLPF